MLSYTKGKLEEAVKVALDAMRERFYELINEYAEQFMSDDLREMLGVYNFNEYSLMGDNDDLKLTAFHYFFNYLNIKDRYYSFKDISDILEKYFDEDTIEYIYDTISEAAHKYERSIPMEVAYKLSTIATEKFGINVGWVSTNYLNNTLVAFELSADKDKVAELYRND